MIDHIDVCLCICKMTLQQSSLKFIVNVIRIYTSSVVYSVVYFSDIKYSKL